MSTSVYGRILKGSSIYSIATIAYRSSSVIMLPLFTRYLTPAEYGAMDILDLSLNVFAMIFGANFSMALFYHFNAASSEKSRNAVVSTTVLGSALLGFLTASIGIAAAGPLSSLVLQSRDYAPYLRLMFLNFAFTLPLEGVLQWLRALDRARSYVGVVVARIALAAVLNFVFLVTLRAGLAGVVYSNLITSSTFAISLAIFCFAETALTFEAATFRRLLNYSIPVTLTGVALFTIHYADRFILKRYTTLTEIGLYSLAYKIGMLVSNFHSSFQAYWTAQMYTLMKGSAGERLFSSLFTYLVLFLAFIGVVLTISSGPVLAVMSAPEFWGARLLVPYIVFAYIVRAVGDHFRGLFYTENRPGLDARLNWIGAGVCIAAYAVLIPRFKVWGAIAATILAFSVIAILGFRWITGLRDIRLEGSRIFKVCLCAATVVFLTHFIPPSPAALSLVLNGFALLVFPVGLWIMRFTSAGENAALSAVWLRARGKLAFAAVEN